MCLFVPGLELEQAAGNLDGAKAAWKSIVDEFPDSAQAVAAARTADGRPQRAANAV